MSIINESIPTLSFLSLWGAGRERERVIPAMHPGAGRKGWQCTYPHTTPLPTYYSAYSESFFPTLAILSYLPLLSATTHNKIFLSPCCRSLCGTLPGFAISIYIFFNVLHSFLVSFFPSLLYRAFASNRD